MEHVNPGVRIRLTHAAELALHLLNGVLFQVGQDEQQFVCHRRQGTGIIRTVAATRARLPINRAVLQVGHKRLREMG